MIKTLIVSIATVGLLTGCGQGKKNSVEQTSASPARDSVASEPKAASPLSALEQDSLLYQEFRGLFPEVKLPVELTNAGLEQYWQGSIEQTKAFLNKHPKQVDKKFSKYLACSSGGIFSKSLTPEPSFEKAGYVMRNVYIPYGRFSLSTDVDAFIVIKHNPEDKELAGGPEYELYLCTKWTTGLRGSSNCFSLQDYMRGYSYLEKIELSKNKAGLLTYRFIDNYLNRNQVVVDKDTTVVFLDEKGDIKSYTTTVEPTEP